MRVFISSTIYDLMDVRAELSSQLTSLGIIPVMSDDKLSDFRVQPDADSIETCLVNVKSCDEMIVILDRRYGPRLKNSGFEDISATHLEYRKAKEHKLPIHFYVRDRLDGEHSLRKRNKNEESISYPWVGKNDYGLFELLEEHSKLEANSGNSNWYYTFTNSIDLKAAVSKYFGTRVLSEHLVRAIQSNAFPVLDMKVDVELGGNNSSLKFKMMISNVGGGPAFNCRFYSGNTKLPNQTEVFFAPSQSISMAMSQPITSNPFSYEKYLLAFYDSPIGITIVDSFKIHAWSEVHIDRGAVTSITTRGGGYLSDRKFYRTKPVQIQIDDLPSESVLIAESQEQSKAQQA